MIFMLLCTYLLIKSILCVAFCVKLIKNIAFELITILKYGLSRCTIIIMH